MKRGCVTQYCLFLIFTLCKKKSTVMLGVSCHILLWNVSPLPKIRSLPPSLYLLVLSDVFCLLKYFWLLRMNEEQRCLCWTVTQQGGPCALCSVTQLCPALCDPLDCSPPGSSVHRISQARILEWVVISFPRGSSQSRGSAGDRTCVSCVGRWILYHWATREAVTT